MHGVRTVVGAIHVHAKHPSVQRTAAGARAALFDKETFREIQKVRGVETVLKTMRTLRNFSAVQARMRDARQSLRSLRVPKDNCARGRHQAGRSICRSTDLRSTYRAKGVVPFEVLDRGIV